MTDPHLRPQLMVGLNRRRFLAGLAASGALAACGGSTGDTESSADGAGGYADSSSGVAGNGFTLVQRFPNNVQIPGEIRMPITLSTGSAEFIQDGPATLTARVLDINGVQLGNAISAIRRDVPPAPYYDFRTTIDAPGFYALAVAGGPDGGAAFQVMDPRAVAVPTPGEMLPDFDTPTVSNPQGFEVLCSRTPDPCPFHGMTLTEALDAGRPVAYYVGTPAFCSTGSCAPALEALIRAQERFEDTFTFIHAEVFSDAAGTAIAPAVTAVGMTYEPALFITDATGTVVERLDAVWDQTELEERLALAT
ncbi:MAG: hypothetical protein P8M10_09775 [Ilumatobacter sp.]|nr:hypothetical protein [Ilumatobacter sp.]